MAGLTREEIEGQFEVVHVTQQPSEAEAVAAQLRRQDVIAIAYARPDEDDIAGEDFQACVLVHETDVDRANELLGMAAPEGNATVEEIARALVEPVQSGWHTDVDHRRARWFERTFWSVLLLFAVIFVLLAAASWLGLL